MQNPFSKIVVEHRRKSDEDDTASFTAPKLTTEFFEVGKLGSPRSDPVRTPTIEDLRQKAQECRAEAESYLTADLRTQLLGIADEYERLALRAEQFEARSRDPYPWPLNGRALTHWFE